MKGHWLTVLAGFNGRLAVSLGILFIPWLEGCEDWPHFNYQASDLLLIEGEENPDGESVQNLGTLTGNALITGVIESGAFLVDWENPFLDQGWYEGDLDWYQFSLLEERDARFTLDWSQSENDLDLMLLKASNETGYVDELLLAANDSGEGPEIIGAAALQPDQIYVLCVAGADAFEADYELLLEFGR